MKLLFNIASLAALIPIMLLPDHATAQNDVQLTLSIPEIGSPYLHDYIGFEGNRVLTLTNLSRLEQSVYLHGSIEQINSPGYYFKTVENFRPARPIVLGPNETKVLFARSQDWSFIEERNLDDNVPPAMKRQIAATGILPEGEYQICVQAFDFNTRRPLSQEAPAGCLFFVATMGTPPQIVQPQDGDPITQEYPTITWTPAIILQSSARIRYDLYVVELTSRALNPYEVMEQSIQYRGGNPFVIENLAQTSYQFLPGDPPLKPDSRYAIFVVAKDDQGSSRFENDGRSEITIIETPGAEPDRQADTDPVVSLIDPSVYQLPSISSLHGNLQYRFYGDGSIDPSDVTIIGGDYNPETTMQLQPGNSLQNRGYQPESRSQVSEGFPGPGETSIDMSAASFDNNIFTTLPPPQFMLPPGYHTFGGKPLKQAAIRFTARYAVGKKNVIQHPDDLQFVSASGNSLTVTGTLLAEPLTVPGSGIKVVASTTTDDNGNYSVSFLADENFGKLADGPVEVQHGVGDLPMTATGYGLYRVITMEVEEKWYAHPDVVIFMQPGQSLEVPDQAVTVQSYNLEVQVRAKYTEYDHLATDGGPIIGAVVKLGRNRNYHENAPESFPKDEVETEVYGHLSIGSPYSHFMLADSTIAGTSGDVEFHRLVKHDGLAGCERFDETVPGWSSDGYLLEADSHPTQENLNYHRYRIPNLAPCAARLASTNFGCSGNNCAPRSADYTPPTIVQKLELSPLFPKLYVQSRAVYMQSGRSYGGIYDLPKTKLLLLAYDQNEEYLGYMIDETDGNGLFTKQYNSGDIPDLLRFDSEKGVTTKYVLDYWKSGFKKGDCNDCGSYANKKILQMGQTWDVNLRLEPGSLVKGRVVDEHGQPIYGDVKIGDGPYLPLDMKYQSVDAGQQSPVFQMSPEWIQQFGSVQQQNSSGFQQGGFQLQNEGQVQNQQSDIQTQSGQDFSNVRVVSQGGYQAEYHGGVPVNPDFEKVSVFEQSAQYGSVQMIIRPDASNYFTDTLVVNIPQPGSPGCEGEVCDLGTFVISERLKRPQIMVSSGEIPIFDPVTQQITEAENIPVVDAEVLLSNFPSKTTNAQGIAEFDKFGSPSNEFRLRVNKEGFVPYDQYITIPATKIDEPTLIEVDLQNGRTVAGTVTRADGGQPIEGARVYAEIGANNYGPILLETFSDSTGQYQLAGVPNFQVNIKAAKTDDPAVTYIGQEKTLTASETGLNFELEEAPFLLSHIWNLPVDLESITPSGDNWSISGAFVDLPPNERFSPENENQRLSFSDIVVQTAGQPNQNGPVPAEPLSSAIKTTTTQFRSVLNGVHIVEMSGPLGQDAIIYTYNDLFEPVNIYNVRVENADDNNGQVKVRAFTGLEYMRFTYQYNGQFYLGETPQTKIISAYTGGAEADMPDSYNLMSNNNPGLNQVTSATEPDFTIHNFPAVIDPHESYVRADTFAISTKLIVDLPLSNPEELIVSAGHIYVTPEKIILLEGQDNSLEFNLETWNVKTGPWMFDPEQGGLITSGVIQTDLLELPAPNMLIKPNHLKLPPAGQIDLDKITLGGVLDVDIHNDANLLFDHVTSTKHNPDVPHWRVLLSNYQQGQNETVGIISGLPGWPSQTEIGIDFIENFSGPPGNTEGRLELDLAPNQQVDHYHVIKQQISNIYLHQDGVVFSGNTDLEIPNLSAGATASFVYYEEENEVKLRVQGLYTLFETEGKVEFQGDQQFDRMILDWDDFDKTGHFEVTGDLRIYEDEFTAIKRPDDEWLRAKLIKKPGDDNTCVSASTNQTSAICIEIIDVDGGGQLEGGNQQAIALGGGQEGLKRLLVGSQHVVGNEWNELTYHAQFEGFGGNSFDGQDTMWFVVKGDIENDQSKNDEIDLTNIGTPFGDFKLTFDIEEQALHGHLKIGKPITMGAVQIVKGDFNLLMGGLGFYIAASIDGIYPVIGQLPVNFIAGYYPQLSPEVKGDLLKNMYIQKLPDFLETSGIQGLYFSANKNVGFPSVGVPPVFTVSAEMGADARSWFNFSDELGAVQFEVLGYAAFKISGFAPDPVPPHLPCKACAGLLAEAYAKAKYQWSPQSEFELEGCGMAGLSLSMSCPFYSYNLSESAKINIVWNSNDGFDVSFSLSGTCSDNAITSGLSCN